MRYGVFMPQPITIATFNVNSVKARLQNLLAWLDASRTDIVLLQELKCMDDAFPAMEIEERWLQHRSPRPENIQRRRHPFQIPAR